uniref:CinA family protein n=1 Tax=candidate division WOR-3 bacterium TaxID=2052148 RepID=A0A7C4XFA4_UNCW3
MFNRFLKEIARKLLDRKLTISVCESCTGGMLGAIITSLSGSSKYFSGGIIAYSNRIKEKIVGVRPGTLRKFGAVSSETALEMAKNVRKRLNSDIGISITGIAGPAGGTKKKPVGLVYIGLASKKEGVFKKFLFKGNREAVRKKSCREALLLLRDFLEY